MATTFFYLHGWASGPGSSKARFFREQFARLGLELHVPDLNLPDFHGLSLGRQLAQVGALLPDAPVALLGSSFGALTALWLAERHPQVERLALFAPAIQFAANVRRMLGEDACRQWQAAGELAVYHHARQREQTLDHAFLADLAAYPDAQLRRNLPTLLAHGRHDASIPIGPVRDFAAARPWIDFHEMDSDHGLNDVQPRLWELAGGFLGLA